MSPVATRRTTTCIVFENIENIVFTIYVLKPLFSNSFLERHVFECDYCLARVDASRIQNFFVYIPTYKENIETEYAK